jgi:predicted CXXCH cytochrome family protein
VTPDGNRIIECIECHQTETGGGRMRPISMDEHCSGCHSLVFDPDDPTREVPHGDPEGVLQVLIEYYSARLLGADPDAVNQRIRRPGQALSRVDRDRAAAEARVKALEVAEDLFERRACINCHEVTRVTSDDEMPWRVQPVRLTEVFFPRANFSHAAHDTEVTGCNSCHNAGESESASDLLMPDIETCRDCHGSGAARRNDSLQIPSGCVMCHSFHFATEGSYP